MAREAKPDFDLQRFREAQRCLERLANGVDPLSGAPLPKEDTVNQVQVSRSLFLAARVLERVIEQKTNPQDEIYSGIFAQGVPFDLPETMSQEEKDSVVLSSSPISISEMAKRLNAAIASPHRDNIRYSFIGPYLLSLDILKPVPADEGRKFNSPTSKGKSLGFLVEDWVRSSGRICPTVMCSLPAQRFLVEHVNDILAFGRKKYQRQGQPWTYAEDQRLFELYQQNLPLPVIASILHRRSSCVEYRAIQLGFIAPNGKPFPPR